MAMKLQGVNLGFVVLAPLSIIVKSNHLNFSPIYQCWKNPGEFKSESIFPAKY